MRDHTAVPAAAGKCAARRHGAGPGPPGEGADAPPDQNPGEENGAARRDRPPLRRALILFLIKLALAASLVWGALTYVGGVFICHNNDMYPALRDGDLVITFRLGGYHTGDIAVCRVNGQTFFGRIVGEPGDEIFLDEEGEFTVNGLRPYETVFYATAARESDVMTYPYIIQPGEYFLLADARETGMDSRAYGPVTELMGKVVLEVRRRGF